MPTLFVTSPIEDAIVDRLRALDPRLTVAFDPALVPAARFPSDHIGGPFARTPEQQLQWEQHLAEADILWGVPEPADAAKCTRLAWIQDTSTGSGPSVAKLNRPDLLVTTARGVHARPLAEFTFMALLAHFRGLARLKADQAARRWIRGHFDEVAGKTLVILGAGDVARGCARIARALDMRIVAIARDPTRARAHAALFDQVLPTVDLHQAMAGADAFVITVPITPETYHLVDTAALSVLKRGAALVNIGRGPVVDESALVAALRSGQVGYAALDVTAAEPLQADSPLWDMPNVLISPHSASTVAHENHRIVDIFQHNLACWLAGNRSEMRNVLDQDRLY
jgi:phosphoglycerate dehydrogenase-like enzyme